ncbi:MAG TPA: histidine phosphatase family protein [Planctomycetaceae bacterium]|nr:histidine phosphatase family protein [Planctomycetaceae bacterium]
MSGQLQVVSLARHGETEWTRTGQHTGLTDIPLTEQGVRQARALGERLRSSRFDRVFTSPLQRAARTCELAGFGQTAEIDPDLVEWNYGDYEGLKSAEIHERHPGWDVFLNGCPGGESLADIAARADRVVARVRAIPGNVLLFSSGHILRVIAARWLGLDVCAGRYLMLSTATLSELSYEHRISDPAVKLWNDALHLED